jgi:peptidyl-prolyl cis-trans isomerase B (cyclophilin B)
MKLHPIVLALLFGLAGPVLADDVAVFDVRIGKTKATERFVVELFEGDAPGTAANFRKLVKKGYYNGMSFHRVFKGTLVQVGDPLSKKKDRMKVGTGGPGYTLAPEIRRKHGEGTLAMARLPDRINPGRRSNGSQFYITLKPMPELDGEYTVFGRVIEGMELLDTISRKPADTNDSPIERVTVRKARMVPRERAGA